MPQAEFMTCISRSLSLLRDVEGGNLQGHYLEFGVSRGTSMACVYRVLQREGLTVIDMVGFDSFEGMPQEAADQGWQPGRYKSTISATRAYLRRHGGDLDRIELVAGWFKDTLTEETRRKLSIERACLIMIDCDIYSASVEALRFCAPLINRNAVIIFDDWGWREQEGKIGQKEAFAEFLESNTDLAARALDAYCEHARVFLVSRRPTSG